MCLSSHSGLQATVWPLSMVSVLRVTRNRRAAPCSSPLVFRDLKSCGLGASLGYDGKWAIHPAQLDTINKTFSPSDEDITRARRILQAYEEAKASGAGATAVDGKMVDTASIRLASITYEYARRLGLMQQDISEIESSED